MDKTLQKLIRDHGFRFVGKVDAQFGPEGAAELARFYRKRMQIVNGKRRKARPSLRDRKRLIAMSAATVQNLDVLAERLGRETGRKITQAEVAALLLEQAVAQELARSG